MTLIKKFVAAICFSSISFGALALPITYDFTVENFSSMQVFAPTPYSSISGSFTLDGTQVDAINLTIGSHSFSASEVGVAMSMSNDLVLGGTLTSIHGLMSGTNDFWFNFDPISLAVYQFIYVTPGSPNFYRSYQGSISIHQDNKVPEPASLALVALGVASAAMVRRRSGK